ncbi:nucleocapsid protein [Gierle apodemus virus]|uniref:Nucleocapsid n=1 Tax=Gierle apodemus virus TaxID=2940985 RepID=A0AAE9HR79_9MONO|nr:nucleocapsid protein [Gierle apodemus virus]
MSSIFSTLRDFKKSKLQLSRPSGAGALLTGVKSTVIVPVPGNDTVRLRWDMVQLLIRIIWNPRAPLSVVTGAMMSLLSLFVENPSALIQRVVDDPDINIKLVEIVYDRNEELVFASRGADLTQQSREYMSYAIDDLGDTTDTSPFEDPMGVMRFIEDPDQFSQALGSILCQTWILLPKAVTAPDTASESEHRRWVKYVQQRRVVAAYALTKTWLDITRDRIAQSLSIRRFMVNLMIDTKHSPGSRPRIAELICDISNYVEETGLAGFMLTLKFGIETAYPALALREFASELSTLQELMILYKELGDTAPYMVLLEASIQNKFSPGNYPLIWSYSMGVGVQLERSVGALNYTRPYLDYPYFRLGQEMVRRAAGTVNKATAIDIGITEEDRVALQEAIGIAAVQGNEPTRIGHASNVSYMRVEGVEQGESSTDQTNRRQPGSSSETQRPPRATAATGATPSADPSTGAVPKKGTRSQTPQLDRSSHTPKGEGISQLKNVLKGLQPIQPLNLPPPDLSHETRYDDKRLV